VQLCARAFCTSAHALFRMIDLARILQKLHARQLSHLQPILILKGSGGHFCAGADIRQTIFSRDACTNTSILLNALPALLCCRAYAASHLEVRRAATASLMSSPSSAAPLPHTSSPVLLFAATRWR
jgi:hypothetical protein